MKDRLKEYIEKDEIYQDYKKDKLMNATDFDKFCIQHCKDIEELCEENEELKKELNELQKPQIFIDTQDIEERYGEELYQDYLEEQVKELKKQLEVGEEQYNDLVEEKEKLEEQLSSITLQLEENKNPLKGIFAQVNDDMLLRNCGAMQSEIDEYKTQQQEFIKYLKDEISKYSEAKEYAIEYHESNLLIKKINVILQKYREIIGVKDENTKN